MGVNCSLRDAYMMLEGSRDRLVSFMCSSRECPYLESLHDAGRGDRKVRITDS